MATKKKKQQAKSGTTKKKAAKTPTKAASRASRAATPKSTKATKPKAAGRASRKGKAAEADSAPAALPPPPPPDTPAAAIDPRTAAREARATKRLEREKVEAEAKSNGLADPPAVTTGDSAEEAAGKRESLETQIKALRKEAGAPPVEEFIPLNENDSFKLEALEGRVKEAEKVVKAPLIQAIQGRLSVEISAIKAKWDALLEKSVETALEKDKAYVAANRAHLEACNEVLKKVGPTLKDGYWITNVEPEKQRLKIEHVPKQVGQLFDIP